MSTSGTPRPQPPPATPTYVLRGHNTAIQALHFYSQNSFLISGDSDGWVVVWSLASKRSVACWRAHGGGILGIRSWGVDKVVTHGRDHGLLVWQLKPSSLSGEVNLDARLPGDEEVGEIAEWKRREPWLLHSMAVSALNFCAFALCEGSKLDGEKVLSGEEALLAVPNALDMGAIDFFQLPSERRLSVLRSDSEIKTGMVMALDLSKQPSTGLLIVVSAYEDGHTLVHQRRQLDSGEPGWVWDKLLVNRPHSQPVLSLDILPSKEAYLASSADALISKSKIPAVYVGVDVAAKMMKINNTKHAGQQDLTVRDDGKIFATAGWDARIRVYSCKTLKELAVLKWHKHGCCSVAFAKTLSLDEDSATAEDPSQLSLALTSSSDSALKLIKSRRDLIAQKTHWLAAGGKDAKISLWNIY